MQILKRIDDATMSRNRALALAQDVKRLKETKKALVGISKDIAKAKKDVLKLIDFENERNGFDADEYFCALAKELSHIDDKIKKEADDLYRYGQIIVGQRNYKNLEVVIKED